MKLGDYNLVAKYINKFGSGSKLETWEGLMVDISLSERDITITEKGKRIKCSGHVVCSNSFNPSENQASYKVKILNKGDGLCVGMCTTEGRTDVGWYGKDTSNAWMYRTSGSAWGGGSVKGDYGEEYKNGDTIEVILNFTNGTISFKKNGKDQGIAFNDLPTNETFYPCFDIMDGEIRLLE